MTLGDDGSSTVTLRSGPPLDEVRYVCYEDYDGGPFLAYSQRPPYDLTYDRAIGGGSDGKILSQNSVHQIPSTPELKSHTQTWQSFGLLSEVLGDLYSKQDFIVRD